MIYNWGDESPHINNMASKASRMSNDYEWKPSLYNKFKAAAFNNADMSRTDCIALVSSVAGALLVFSSFVHADTIKNVIADTSEFVQEVVTTPGEVIQDIENALIGIRQ